MLYNVLLTARAERDIDDIHTYIAENDGTSQADKVMTALEACMDKLSEFPERGNIPKELRSAALRGYREVHYKPYRILYRIEDNKIAIIGILDGRRDMETLLKQRLLR